MNLHPESSSLRRNEGLPIDHVTHTTTDLASFPVRPYNAPWTEPEFLKRQERSQGQVRKTEQGRRPHLMERVSLRHLLVPNRDGCKHNREPTR